MIRRLETLLFAVNQQNKKQLPSNKICREAGTDWLNWSWPIEMLICYQGYSGLVRGILLMEMKDLLLADCLACTGFGGRACLRQSL